ncbi:glycosyltransferase family A protein [uncultured Thomasclavelia sp.]|mgnify:CR=1 FL=1|uniref:glycosyltransferase family A protein n=1 Tax=uncultured Thomasclavelia sp. TaxID=3025759 RepID=UPI0026141F7E|nr:glycosyltransferase family A protein [uncultured Thomasclavelia sp.]
MEKIYIVTPTYNGSKTIGKLYESLIDQNNKNFIWIIIDDGSIDNTNNIIMDIKKENKLDIQYILKNNGGKSSAINLAIELISDQDFMLIVDNDEELFPDAINKVWLTIKKYENENVGVIHFNRIDMEKDKIIANPYFGVDKFLSYYEWRNKGYYADGYLGYYGYALKNKRFPLFNGEKYIAPSILVMNVCNSHKMVWSCNILGKTKYQDGGITKQGRKLRVKNPLSMIYYCLLLQDNRLKFSIRLKYSVCGYAYKNICGYSDKMLMKNNLDMKKFIRLMKIPGLILSLIWKKNKD